MIGSFIRILTTIDRRPGLSVLLFHRVLEHADEYRWGDPTSDEFESIIEALSQSFRVLPLADAVRGLKSGNLPRGAVSITFDDGYRDNLTQAAPILKRHGLGATFFISTGFCNGDWMWNDRVIEIIRKTKRNTVRIVSGAETDITIPEGPLRTATAHRIIDLLKYLEINERTQSVDRLQDDLQVELPPGPMMNPTEIRELRSMGMTIGAHTVVHPILSQTNRKRAHDEIFQSRQYLSDLLREPIYEFAYPNGSPIKDFGKEHRDGSGCRLYRCVYHAPSYCEDKGRSVTSSKIHAMGQAWRKVCAKARPCTAQSVMGSTLSDRDWRGDLATGAYSSWLDYEFHFALLVAKCIF
jgi:peptidoglycan/xylan/chitin deacetylase (PgdA/CDA1 family)